MYKKSQIKFGETIGILFIVYLVLVFGIMWYNDQNNEDLNQLYDENAQERSLEKYYYIVYSDLLKTSQRGFEKNYFDLLSLKTFANYSKSQAGEEYLGERLGEGLVTLRLYNGSQVFNEGGVPNEKLILYNNSPEFREQSQIIRRQVFTSLIPVQNDYESKMLLGILRVEVPFYE